jgi:leucine dehydrogenase
MLIFEHPSFDAHENVIFCSDPVTQLKAIIAIHDTTLGPAVGGCRIWSYSNEEDALTDALRLSKGMSYKNAIAGLSFGGGKAVILKPKFISNRQALFESFGRMVHQLNGRYYSAEDIGTNTKDVMAAYSQTPYMVGLEGQSGDPSPITAIGVVSGMKAALEHQRGDRTLKGIKVSVQGVGQVGYYLCQQLHQEGAHIIATDVNPKALERVVHEFQATPVTPDKIYQQPVDIFAPCALGGILNDQTIAKLQATIVAGSANNQLHSRQHGQQLLDKKILYAPDYVINAGGIINVSYEQNYDATKAIAKVQKIARKLKQIFHEAQNQGLCTNMVADLQAQQIINDSKSQPNPPSS